MRNTTHLTGINRRQALAALAAPTIAASTATAAVLSQPDADADLFALCDQFHRLSAEIDRLYALPSAPGEWEVTAEQAEAWSAQNAVADQVAGIVPATLSGFFAKLSVVVEDHAGSDIPATLLLRVMEEGGAVTGLPCPPLNWLRTEAANERRLIDMGVA